MDAGKFNLNFNINGLNLNRVENKVVNQEPKANNEPEAQAPKDQVSFKSLETPLANLETPAQLQQTPAQADLGEIAGVTPSSVGKSQFSPIGLIDLNTIDSLGGQALNSLGGGITALNTLGSTSLSSIGGVTRASANVLNPVGATRMPTTSISTNGIESTEFVTSSGRVVSAGQKPAVKMPTTSISLLNGLESNVFETTSGRLIAL